MHVYRYTFLGNMHQSMPPTTEHAQMCFENQQMQPCTTAQPTYAAKQQPTYAAKQHDLADAQKPDVKMRRHVAATGEQQLCLLSMNPATHGNTNAATCHHQLHKYAPRKHLWYTTSVSQSQWKKVPHIVYCTADTGAVHQNHSTTPHTPPAYHPTPAAHTGAHTPCNNQRFCERLIPREANIL